jgi:hypothetical protein
MSGVTVFLARFGLGFSTTASSHRTSGPLAATGAGSCATCGVRHFRTQLEKVVGLMPASVANWRPVIALFSNSATNIFLRSRVTLIRPRWSCLISPSATAVASVICDESYGTTSAPTSGRPLDAYLVLSNVVSEIAKRLKDPSWKEMVEPLKLQLNDVMTFVRAEAAKPDLEHFVKPAQIEPYKKYTNKIQAILPESRDSSSIVEMATEVENATDEFLEESNLSKCPLCEGSGDHHRHICPICGGDGTVQSEDLAELDLSPYKQVQCPLCKGSGVHNRVDCQVCDGQGTIDEKDEGQIDLSPFNQKKCPLCKGSGEHNRFDCPICLGVGTIDEYDDEAVDLTAFEQTKCPLCKGSGAHRRRDCPICYGVGTIDASNGHEIDLEPYRQVRCELCKGTCVFRDHECPLCEGEGKIDAGLAENVDLSAYYED